MKKQSTFFSCLFSVPAALLVSVSANAQETIPVPDNLTAKLPPLPKSIIEEVKPYTESRGATFLACHLVAKEILISTRFGNAAPLRKVS